MRTTITLDPDTAALIRKALKESEISFKELVNKAIRQGLQGNKSQKGDFHYATVPHHAGRLLASDPSNIGETLAILEEESFKSSLK